MKKGERRVLKKGRIVVTRKGSFVIKLADKTVRDIKPYCKRIKIAGSIRRKKEDPVDIDIVLIPKDKDRIKQLLLKEGKVVENGEKQFSVKIKGVKVELYFVSEEDWGAALISYTGASGYSIGLRIKAKKKGLKLNQYGLFKGNKKIAGKTEQEIYEALGKHFKLPENRK
jgi:DNA polymerase (family X)